MSLTVSIEKHFANFSLDVSFQAGNETIGLLGSSGCGKSLTLRCIAGLEKPDFGRISAADMLFYDSVEKVNLTAQQRKTALLFQNYMLFPNLTVAQNIAAGIPRSTPRPEVKAMVEEQLLRFGLKGFGKRYPVRLSGGQQQRVALARMLAAKPAILMLDEPFSALDAHLKSSLETDMLDLFDSFDGTIVYVSHDIDEAFRFCNRIAVIDQGRLQEISSPAQILNHPSTIATLRVSGVKNISKARKLSKYKVEACDWGIELQTEEPVSDDVAYLGIRASFIEPASGHTGGGGAGQAIEPASGQAVNCFDCRLLRAIDSRFERNLVLQPTPAAKSPLQWRFNIADNDLALPPGHDGYARVFIPPSKIYLVKD